MSQPPAPIATAAYMIELGVRLGVPTLFLVLGMFMILPRLDRGITIAERVDAQMSVFLSDCISDRRSIDQLIQRP